MVLELVVCLLYTFCVDMYSFNGLVPHVLCLYLPANFDIDLPDLMSCAAGSSNTIQRLDQTCSSPTATLASLHESVA